MRVINLNTIRHKKDGESALHDESLFQKFEIPIEFNPAGGEPKSAVPENESK